MKLNPIFGAGMAGKSLVVTAARRLNVYYENRPDKDKTAIAVYGTPGMKLAFSLGTSKVPPRGVASMSGIIFTVLGNQFTAATPAGVIIATGTMTTTAGICSLAVNPPTQVMVVDGTFGYIWNTSLNTLAQITSGGFPNGCHTCAFLNDYFAVEVPNTQEFMVSNFNDGTTWSSLSVGAASLASDLIVAVDAYQGNLIPFSQQHLEFWQLVGSVPQPFQPIISATSEWGLGATFGRVHLNDCLYFLGASPQGGFSICEISGYAVKPVSDPDLDSIINSFSTVSDCVALAYRADRHPMAQFTFPSAGRSFLFDCLTRIFSEVQSGTTPAYAQRHIGQFAVNVAGVQLITDYALNNFYTADPKTYQDNGSTLPRQIITKHHLEDFNTFSVDEAYLDVETGVGLSSGQGSNPMVSLSCSKNDGRTYCTERWSPMQAQGVYGRMPPWRRWGSARTFTFKTCFTDPVKFALTAPATSETYRPQP